MKNNLQRKQLDEKFKAFSVLRNSPPPVGGWLKAIRTTLGMSLQQLGNKLGVTKQSIQSLEKREIEGNITINSLKETAHALDMKFVYVLLPKDGSLEQLIERKAAILAKEIVMRTTQTMALEDQENAQARLKDAIEERKKEIIESNPKILWD
ncbi:mobile mystery protein A [Sphingobacterium cavernae]|uniref:mobile mystery protein A n=1 Tax=Sphingobacterium cavernae TaxID=2592657 RepID=UPI0012301D9A|nr:mobile mystery protein A [Sphingobacterium cavernae]